MTQIQQPQTASILAGPKGVGARAAGGAYTQDCQQDLIDADSFEGPPIYLLGTTDAITSHLGGNYVVKTGSANAITLFTPTAGVDDNLVINIWSDTLFAHTITAASACIANGVATVKTVITFNAFRGAGVTLRAMNGSWQVVGQTGVASYA